MVSEAPSGQVKRQVMGALNRVGLERKARYFRISFPAGKTRVALARAIVNPATSSAGRRTDEIWIIKMQPISCSSYQRL